MGPFILSAPQTARKTAAFSLSAMETALVVLVFTLVFVEISCKGESEFVDEPWTPLVERFNEIMKGIEENNGKKGMLEKVLIESIESVISKDCSDGLVKDIGGPYTTDVPEVFTKLYVLRHPRDQIEEQLYWILPSVECIAKILKSSSDPQPSRPLPSIVPVPTEPTTKQSPTSKLQSQVKPGPPSVSSPPPPPSKPEYVIVENPGGGKVLGVVASPFKPTPPKAKQPGNSAPVKSNPTIPPSHSSQRPQAQGVQGLGMQQSPPQEQSMKDNSNGSPVKDPYYLPDENVGSALNKGNNREPNYEYYNKDKLLPDSYNPYGMHQSPDDDKSRTYKPKTIPPSSLSLPPTNEKNNFQLPVEGKEATDPLDTKPVPYNHVPHKQTNTNPPEIMGNSEGSNLKQDNQETTGGRFFGRRAPTTLTHRDKDGLLSDKVVGENKQPPFEGRIGESPPFSDYQQKPYFDGSMKGKNEPGFVSDQKNNLFQGYHPELTTSDNQKEPTIPYDPYHQSPEKNIGHYNDNWKYNNIHSHKKDSQAQDKDFKKQNPLGNMGEMNLPKYKQPVENDNIHKLGKYPSSGGTGRSASDLDSLALIPIGGVLNDRDGVKHYGPGSIPPTGGEEPKGEGVNKANLPVNETPPIQHPSLRSYPWLQKEAGSNDERKGVYTNQDDGTISTKFPEKAKPSSILRPDYESSPSFDKKQNSDLKPSFSDNIHQPAEPFEHDNKSGKKNQGVNDSSDIGDSDLEDSSSGVNYDSSRSGKFEKRPVNQNNHKRPPKQPIHINININLGDKKNRQNSQPEQSLQPGKTQPPKRKPIKPVLATDEEFSTFIANQRKKWAEEAKSLEE